MKFLLFVPFVLMQIGIFAQQTPLNWIQNPSFEDSDLTGITWLWNSYHPKTSNEFEKRASGWFAPWASKPSFRDSVEIDIVENKPVGRALLAIDGRRFVCLTTHGCSDWESKTEGKTRECREYLGQKLKKLLRKSNIYKIEVDAARHPNVAINKLGFFFSEKAAQSDKIKDGQGYPIHPQVVFDSILCKTPMTWYRLSAIFQLNTDASYFYFGNFAPLNEYQKIYKDWKSNDPYFYNRYHQAAYFFDNFNLTEIQSNVLIINELPKYSITLLSSPTHPNTEVIQAVSSTTVKQSPVSIAPKQKIVLNNMLFETNSANLKTVQLPELDEFCQKLLENPKLTLQITGHTDNIGNPVQNQQLSEKRAHTIAQYLQRKGIAAQRIQKQGRGATQPIADNQTIEGREKNRRVEIEINP